MAFRTARRHQEYARTSRIDTCSVRTETQQIIEVSIPKGIDTQMSNNALKSWQDRGRHCGLVG